MDLLPKPIKFDWDKGNINKSVSKHRIKNEEVEEVFVSQPIVLLEDTKHSRIEQRQMILGRTDKKKLLSIVFTIRKNKIRVISSRMMSRKERRLYEEKTKRFA
ncbi:MAG: BrnT family toxin [Patescibacteria group bacterium]|nr:BrnT family toxin [Patescibacteria group bacterium]